MSERIDTETAQRCLDIAKGCHDYNGGHHEEPAYGAFHHGIDTVINCLKQFLANNGEGDLQLKVVESIGRSNRGDTPTPPPKRPFLSDSDIESKIETYDTSSEVEKLYFGVGARWTRDRYEARDAGNSQEVTATDAELFVEYQRHKDDYKSWFDSFKAGYKFRLKKLPAIPWTPEVGMKCAFWNNEFDELSYVGSFIEFHHRAPSYFTLTTPKLGQWFDNCALIESLDEIGKPPQYFIQRGRCTQVVPK